MVHWNIRHVLSLAGHFPISWDLPHLLHLFSSLLFDTDLDFIME